MRIYAQSKSGDLNSTFNIAANTLHEALSILRQLGGYYVKEGDSTRYVPFEEIQYIEERPIVH